MLRDRPWLIGMIIAAGLAMAAIFIVVILSVLRDEITQDLPDPGKPLESYAPTTVTGTTDIPYGKGPRQKLDVWFPKSLGTGKALPTIVWAHGGGWSGGDKSFVGPYLKILADRGFTTVGINYSYSGDARYPTQVQEMNAALRFVEEHAPALHVDPQRIVLAGDSAGAQIAAQVASLTTDQTFAAQLGIRPALTPGQVSGVVLASGIYDLDDAANRVQGTVKTFVDGYLGTTSDQGALALASVTPHVTEDFPPTWVTTGNADPLLPQAKTFVRTLEGEGVKVEAEFFAKDHQPQLIHEYQFLLELKASRQVLESAVAFVTQQTG